MGRRLDSRRPLHGAWAPPLSVALLLALGALAGCGGGGEPTLILSIQSRAVLSHLEVYAKQYHDGGRVTLYPMYRTPVPEELEGYVLPAGADPLQVRVDLPEPGRYAIHLVGVPLSAVESDPASDRYIASVCAEIEDATVQDDVLLGRLTRGAGSLDFDGDTFPEDVAAFCAFQADTGLACDTTCTSEDFLAMADCNPTDDWVDPGCGGERGTDAEWNPFVADHCGDCMDRDCYGGDALCEDLDGDGHPGDVDCDDRDPTVYPSAVEICGNGIDENCTDDIAECTDGDVPCDGDGDTFIAQHASLPGCGRDCDDTDPAVNPLAFEGYGSDPSNPDSNPGCGDGIDNNCNDRVDERCSADLDDDGVELSTDCNDCNASIGPGFTEACGNAVDEDCTDGGLEAGDLACSPDDPDRDGFEADNDCDQDDPNVYSGAPERCGDDIAQNCSLPGACSTDADGDQFQPIDGDCDDSNANANPWGVEACDAPGVDEDCDGQVNEVQPGDVLTTGCIFDVNGDDLWTEIYFETDIDHCGSCRHFCQNLPTFMAGNACVDGECTCFGREACPGSIGAFCCEDGCMNLAEDTAHCGDCETTCARYESCEPQDSLNGLGQCWCRRGATAVTCDSSAENACCDGVGCTNTNNDVHNCGDCAIDCETPVGRERGDICALSSGGTATCFCGTVGTVCTGTEWCTEVNPPDGVACGCADLDNDRFNCGQCSHACDENPGGYEDCVEGACRCTPAAQDCAGGMPAGCCPGVDHCVDLLSDTYNCGACGTRCAPGESCTDGSCQCGSGGGCALGSQVCCSGACANVLTDERNCGPTDSISGCGRSCRPGVECEGGSCSCGSPPAAPVKVGTCQT